MWVLNGKTFGSKAGTNDVSRKQTIYTISLCGAIPADSNIPEVDQCRTGTRICMVVSNDKDNEPSRVVSVTPIAGDYGANDLSPGTELGSQDADTKRALSPLCVSCRFVANMCMTGSPLILTIGGGVYNDKPQKARITFLCDASATDVRICFTAIAITTFPLLMAYYYSLPTRHRLTMMPPPVC